MLRTMLLCVLLMSAVCTSFATTAIFTEPVGAQVTPIDDEPDDAPGLGSIIGSPEAGPKPEDAGDRGGYAQLGLALVMAGGIGFIGWRIVREARHNRGNISPDGSL